MRGARAAPHLEPAAATGATPCFFRADGPARFGWVHRPDGAPAETAIVIVPPFGYEAICAHRSLRALAEAAARAGLVAVRFDLDGTGDSEGDDVQPGRLAAWLASIADACDLARGEGAERLVLVGVRLGATLAARAAAARDDVAGLVAIAGVAKGKAYVREARALQMQLGLAPPPPGRAAPPADVHELVGFALPAELRDELAKLDLAAVPRAPGAEPPPRGTPAVLLVDRDDLPGNDAWAAALRAQGAAVEQVRLPGYVEMMLDPHHAIVPRAIVDATVAFARARPPVPPAPRPPRPIARTPRLEAGDIVDEVVAIEPGLVGIASRPPCEPKRAVILLNAGCIHHVGPNRLYVTVARRLAARGVLALRVDLSGIGDSATRPGAEDNAVYGPHALADVAACVAWAHAQGARHVSVTGLCSGAYHAQKAAAAGQPLDIVVPINPMTYFWKPGMPVDFVAARVAQDTKRWSTNVRSAASWRKLLRGEVDVRRVARVLAVRGRAIAESRTREVLRRLHVPLHEDLGSELYALHRTGIELRYIFAAGDPGHAMLFEQGGSAVERMRATGALAIDVIDGPDHTFTPRWSHPLFVDAILRAVGA
jgi:alpha/beta superfamily hydrolase